MGNTSSSDAHGRIYTNLLRIQNHETRATTIEQLLSRPEYVAAAQAAGIYAGVIKYLYAVRAGDYSVPFPGAAAAAAAATPATTSSFLGTLATYTDKINPWKQVIKKPHEKVISYFNSCLEILELDEGDTLTEEKLKVAYKKASIRAHPDKKGGSEEKFQAINRAYNYLMELLNRINGGGGSGSTPHQVGVLEGRTPHQVGVLEGRTPPQVGVLEGPPITGPFTAIAAVPQHQHQDKWADIDPVTFNPKKMDMNQFNQMFDKIKEATSTAGDDGYADWLKNNTHAGPSHKYTGSYNADRFNAAFLEQERENKYEEKAPLHPSMMGLTLAPDMGISLVNSDNSDFTAPANSDLQYSDLKRAYTIDATFTNKVANVVVERRDFESYKAQRASAPTISEEEKARLLQEEAAMKAREVAAEQAKKQQRIQEEAFYSRMKNLVRTQ